MKLLRASLLVMALNLALTHPLLAATDSPPVTVLASLPITYGLSDLLLKDSGVLLERAADANLPGSRQSAYFSGRGAPALQQLASHADAVIDLRALWSEDPLYPMARRSNIRIVEIDATRPVDGSLPGIALQSGAAAEGLNSQPWLSSNNMGRMADVIAADLMRLVPQAKPRIEGNLAALKQRLLKLSARSEGRLASADNLSVYSLSDRLSYLSGGLNLEPVGSEVRSDEEWTDETLKALTDTLRHGEVNVVLDHRQPPARVVAAVSAAGSQLVVIDGDAADPVAGLEASIAQVLAVLAPQKAE